MKQIAALGPVTYHMRVAPSRGPARTADWLRTAVFRTTTLLDTEFGVSNERSWGPHPGPLSIKVVLKGVEKYCVGRTEMLLQPGDVLVLNKGTVYSSESSGSKPTHVLTLFISNDHASRSWSEAAGSKGLPGLGPARVPQIAEYVRSDAPSLFEGMLLLAQEAGRGSRPRFEDQLGRVLELLWRLPEADYHRASRLATSRPRTRMALFRRIMNARDFMRANLHQPLDLSSVARVASVTPCYFNRRFAECEGVPPMEYLRGVRLEAAARLIVEGECTDVRGLCRRVGYANPSSFTRAFRRRFGATPSQIRSNPAMIQGLHRPSSPIRASSRA